MKIFYHTRKGEHGEWRVGIVAEMAGRVHAHGTFINTKAHNQESAHAWAILRCMESARELRVDVEQGLTLAGHYPFFPEAEPRTQANLYLWIASQMCEEVLGGKPEDEDTPLFMVKVCTANNLASEVSKLNGELGLVRVDEDI